MINNKIYRWQRKNRLLSGNDSTNELQGHSVTREMVKLGMIGFAVISVILAIVVGFSGCAAASCDDIDIDDNQAVLAIIGEAEDQGVEGMRAIGFALINRGNLDGVYGLRAKRVVFHKYSNDTYLQAKKAWKYAKNHQDEDSTDGSTGWGNASDIRKFKTQRWFNNCTVVKQVGQQWFYRCDR